MARDKEGAPLRDSEGNVEHVDARAAVRHDGVVFGGVLEVHEGGKNYTRGELCAHIDAAEAAARSRTDAEETAVRAAYVFDATSPVRAETKFRSSMATIGEGAGRKASGCAITCEVDAHCGRGRLSHIITLGGLDATAETVLAQDGSSGQLLCC